MIQETLIAPEATRKATLFSAVSTAQLVTLEPQTRFVKILANADIILVRFGASNPTASTGGFEDVISIGIGEYINVPENTRSLRILPATGSVTNIYVIEK